MKLEQLTKVAEGRPVMPMRVDVSKISESNLLHTTINNVMNLCARMGVAQVENSDANAVIEQDDTFPVLLENADGSYEVVAGHDYVEAAQVMQVPELDARVIPTRQYTTMDCVDKDAPSPKNAPKGWTSMYRTTGGLQAIVIVKKGFFGKVNDLYAEFRIEDRGYTVLPSKHGLTVMPNSAARNADQATYANDAAMMADALNNPQFKGKLVERVRDLLEQ